jgi:methylated-DNA-[protein]-cysteine S-methyltransferase
MQETRYRLPAGSAWGRYDAPIGPLALVVTPAGLLVLHFGPLESIRGGFTVDESQPDGPLPLARHPHGRRVVRELEEYFAEQRAEFTVPIDWSLTSGAQRAILTTLYEKVPFGSTVGYGDLALLSGRTLGASRLVGTVMGSNPVAIVVPCHRVIAADGGIGGFGGGLETKRRLLTLEGSIQPALF